MKAQFCTQCGAKLKPEARFCSACSAKVRQPVSQTRGRQRNKRSSRRSRRKQRRWPATPGILVAGGGVLLLLIGILLIFVNLDRPAPVPATTSTLPDSHDEEGIPYPEVPRISLAEAKARHDAGTALFVDVRGQGQYETAHIPDAISLPLADLDARYQELPRDAEIITYCT